MFCIAICDDCQHEAEVISWMLAKYQTARPGIDFCVRSFDSGEKLLDSINAGEEYDLYLLDVLMPGITGIELALILREKNADVPIVFLTGSADYALSAYKVSAMQYILKPVKEKELFDVADKILALRKLEKDQFFILYTSEGTLKISFLSIVYAEVCNHKMNVCLDNGGVFSSKSMKISFRTAVAPLLEDSRFLSVHKSYVLNMEHVQELKNKSFIMTGGHALPIPKYKLAEAKDAYFRYLSQRGLKYFGG